jgi:hypothetical protein
MHVSGAVSNQWRRCERSAALVCGRLEEVLGLPALEPHLKAVIGIGK